MIKPDASVGSVPSQPNGPAGLPGSGFALQAVVTALPSASLLLTPDWRIAAVSEAYLAVALRTRAQLLGQDLFTVFPGDSDAPEGLTMRNLRASLEQVLATGQAHEMAVQHYNLPATDSGPSLERYWQPLNSPIFASDGTVNGVIHTVVDVTEQVLARLGLAASQDREQVARAETAAQRLAWQRVVEQVPVAVAILEGPAYRLTFANPAMEQLWGRPSQPLLGRPHFEALPDLAGQGLEEVLATVYGSGQPQHLRERVLTLDPAGTGPPALKYFNLTYQPLHDGQGGVRGIICTATEATTQVMARQQAQAQRDVLEASVSERDQQTQLARAEAERQRLRLEQLIMQAPVAICVFGGLQWAYELVNPSYQQLFPGRPLLGLPLMEALPELAGQPLLDILQDVYTTGRPFERKAVLVPLARTEGGPVEDIYFDLTYQARYDTNGQIDGFVTFAQDVTAQVLADRLRQTQQQQLADLFEQAPVAIAIFRGPRYVIEYANPTVCALWGRTTAQALNTPLFELLPEAAGQGFEQLLDEVMATGVPYVARELPAFIDRQGRRDTVYWNFVYQPLREGDGPLTAVTVVATEVTEQVLARQQVQQLNEELQAANQEMSRANTQLTRTNADLDNFIYTASHDLWAPISNIEGLLQALRQDLALPADEAEVPELLQLMQGAVERFKRTIRELTDVARLQQAHAQTATLIDLAQLVEEVRLDLAPQFAATGGELALDITSCQQLVFSEKNLRSIVYNLLSNGLKYHHPDRPPRLLLRCYHSPNYTVLAVRDNGLGLELDQLPKVFGLFQRLHDHVEGSGVGLYIVKRIVENAGGAIEVESEPGVGSTFLVYFPQ